MRKINLFNDNYIFEKEGVTEKVTLPHTWNAADGQSASDYYRGECIYTKKFAKPELKDGEQLYLEITGANSSSKVSLNGKELASHDGGYSTYHVNLTDGLMDENELEIKVDNSPNDHVYPQKADFTFYGGLYRDVRLITDSITGSDYNNAFWYYYWKYESCHNAFCDKHASFDRICRLWSQICRKIWQQKCDCDMDKDMYGSCSNITCILYRN